MTLDCSAPGTDAFVKIEARSSMVYILLGMAFAVMACVAVASAFWYYNTKLKPSIDPDGNRKPPAQQPPPEVSTEYLTVFNQNDEELREFVTNHSSSAVVVAMIFHPGCGHCSNMRSEYSKFAQQVSRSTRKESPIRVIKYFPSNFQEVASIFEIPAESFQGVPHVLMYTRRNGKARSASYEFNKPYSKTHRFRTADSLNAWLDSEIPSLLTTTDLEASDDQKKALDDAVEAATKRKSVADESSDDDDSSSSDDEDTEQTPQPEPEPETKTEPEPEPEPEPAEKIEPEPEPAETEAVSTESTEQTKKKKKKFIRSESWDGHKEGYVYKQGSKGLGYYKEK